MNKPQSFYCYMLADPESEEPFYVGKGKGTRYEVHLRGRSHSRQLRMKIRSLEDRGLVPVVRFVPAGSEKAAHEIEIALIASIGRRDLGSGPLFNQTCGGEGSSGRVGFRHSEESKAKIGFAHRGKPKSALQRSRMSESAKGRPGPSSEQLAAMLAARRRPEVREKLAEAARRAMTPERLSAMVAAARAAVAGVPKSPQTRAKISEAQRGRAISEETRAKMSAAQRRRYAK